MSNANTEPDSQAGKDISSETSAAFTTAFIGAGNMSGAIIAGLLDAGVPSAQISASTPSEGTREKLRQQGLARVHSSNTEAAATADVIVLGVKPKVLREVCRELAPALRADQLVLSVAAGVPARSISDWLSGTPHVIRCMPNTPSTLGAGASALYAFGSIPDEHKHRAQQIMQAVGLVSWVADEALLHAVTAVSGSGPAYFFQFMEAMVAEGERMGLDADTARTLCAQTCIGAGRMLAEGTNTAAELRQKVTSPGGTTAQAVESFRAAGLDTLVTNAMQACYARSEEMADEFS